MQNTGATADQNQLIRKAISTMRLAYAVRKTWSPYKATERIHISMSFRIRLNETMCHIPHLSINSHNENRFIELYNVYIFTKYLDNVVEKILHKKMFKLCLEK